VLGLAVVLLLAGLGILTRRRRAARAGRAQGASAAATNSPAAPRDRLVALAESVRDALTVQFGAASRAKTTEEWAADQRLMQLLGEQEFQELIRFLDQVDRVKFAPERADNHQEAIVEALVTWEPRVARFQARIRAKPGKLSQAGPARVKSPVRLATHRPSRGPRS
jgi:hypothetical protein